MSHHTYPNDGRFRQSPTGGDSGSSYSGQGHGRTILPPLTIAFPTSDSPVSNNYIHRAQRSTPVPHESAFYPPAQQQQQQQQQTQTHAPYPGYHTYPTYQQLSEARYHGQTHGSSYNRASPSSGSIDPWRPPPLNVPDGGAWQGALYPSHTDMQIPPASSDLRSPNSVYSPTTGFPQYQSPTSPAYPAGHSPSRGAVPTVPAAQTYQQSMAMSHASLERNIPTRSAPQLPYARAIGPPVPSPVPFDIPAENPEPTIKKKRKRADARQLEALNRMYARTAFPSTEERLQLAKDLDMSARSVQIWFQNKRQSSRQGGRNPNPGPSVSQVTATLHPELQHVPIHPRASPSPMSPMSEAPYPSRSPLPVMMRSGQTPSPPSGRSRADMDRRYWHGSSRGP